jgi:hypothetical protein
MGITKHTLTIKKYWNGGGDLEFEVSAGFALQVTSANDKVKGAKLAVKREPDKNSTRLNMFAQLRNRGLGFFEVYLTRDTYSDSGQFISRVMYSFYDVGVESVLMRDDKEEITFVSTGFNQMTISKVGITFQSTP